MNYSISSSSVSEVCHHCDEVLEENRILKLKLEKAEENQKELKVLRKIRRELDSIQLIANEYSIEMEDLARGLTFALDKLFAIKSQELGQKGKRVVELIMRLADPRSNISKESAFSKEEESSLSFNLEKLKIEEKQERKMARVDEEPATQKIRRKYENERVEEKNPNPTQKQSRPSLLSEVSGLKQKEENRLNPYLPAERTPAQSKGLSNQDEENQKLSAVNKSTSFDDMCLPLIWEKRTFFDMSNRTITKKYNDIYKKICTEKPLPRDGRHKIKIQMVTNGTVAFGVVTAKFKNEYMIDDKKCDAVKYMSFQNGGGLVNFCGQQLETGERVHLDPGQVLEIHFNADTHAVTFKNPNLERPLEVQLTDRFKNTDLYLFLEMKHFNTAVKMI